MGHVPRTVTLEYSSAGGISGFGSVITIGKQRSNSQHKQQIPGVLWCGVQRANRNSINSTNINRAKRGVFSE